MVIQSLKYVNFMEFEYESVFIHLKMTYNSKNKLYIKNIFIFTQKSSFQAH